MSVARLVRTATAALLLALCLPAFSQTPIQHPKLIEDTGPVAPGLLTCWYNEKQELKGSDSAQPGVKPGIDKSGHGDYAYGYTAPLQDGTHCPAKLPAATSSARTTRSDAGYATFQDHCNGAGAPFISIRMGGDARNVVKLVLEHAMRVHMFLPRGTTYVDECGGFANGDAKYQFATLD